MLRIDVLLTENKLAEQFLASLEQRYLPEKFFYWFPLSVRAWLELCQGAQPYKNFSRSYELMSRHAADVARAFGGTKVEVVSLGAGQGDKDLLMLDALRAAGRTPLYQPVDSSQALLELAVMRAAEAGFETRGLKADIADSHATDALRASADAPRLYLLLGNTLGAFDPPKLLAELRALLRPEDRLLLDGEIYNAQDTMPGYDNPVNRRFAFAPLASVGLEEGRDGALVFESATDSRLDGLHMVTKHFRAARSLAIPVGGQSVRLEAGERIVMSSSCKYSRAAFQRMLRESGGFQPLAEYLSADERFAMALVAPDSR